MKLPAQIIFVFGFFAMAFAITNVFSQATHVQPKYKTVYIPIKKTTALKKKLPAASVMSDSLIRANDSLRYLYFESRAQASRKDSLISALRKKISEQNKEAELSVMRLLTLQSAKDKNSRKNNFLTAITITSVLLLIISLILFFREKNRNTRYVSGYRNILVSHDEEKVNTRYPAGPVKPAIAEIKEPPPPLLPEKKPAEQEPTPFNSSPPADINMRLEQLDHLGKMLEKGILSVEEFNAQKKRLLGLSD